MRILLISDNYPSPENLYGDVFAHTRVKEYVRVHECVVCSTTMKANYSFEGVDVRAFSSQTDLHDFVIRWCPDVVLVHFAFKRTIDAVLMNVEIPVVVWVHGHEALRFDKTRFALPWSSPRNLYRAIYSNVIQLASFRRLVEASNAGRNIYFVFVSEWMKRECENSISKAVHHYAIIPNPIDDVTFSHREKSVDLRFNVLSIRSFSSKKYANDISARAIEIMSRNSQFEKFNFRIYGSGKYFQQIRVRLSGFANVRMVDHFLTHTEVKQQHQWGGLFLCPTRMDAQGVSMCEAMSSGLVPITSKNTAIPEFVIDGGTGYTASSPRELAERMLQLAGDSNKFAELSRAAAVAIRAKAGVRLVIDRELRLIEGLLSGRR